MKGQAFTVRGQVQGVGFRPTVWRLATELGLSGEVRNSGEGVEIRLWGAAVERFAERLLAEVPALARIDGIERQPIEAPAPSGFAIADSAAGDPRVGVTPDAATCPDCLAEVRDPFANRYRYPFANCTNCGPRFSILQGAPYDRAETTMAGFALCPICLGEYRDPADRRFHAQPIACHACGPRAWIERLGGGAVNHEAFSMLDDVDAAGGMLAMGHIVAIKGLGGFHLACDATKAEVVARLRQRKRRPGKAFALMARDLEVIRRYCEVSAAEAEALQSTAAPIVLLRAQGEPLPDAVAPGLDRLGFMLPHTPLHHLMLRRMTRPVVMTSGNVSGQPQCIDNAAARARLAGVADFALLHDREIANRVDDSVLRVDQGRPRLLRRARGYAPAALPLPQGFDPEAQLLALGGELKNTFCLVKAGEAILSQHMGDLEDAATAEEVAHNLTLYRALYRPAPRAIAVDRHPDYFSTKRGRELAEADALPLVEVQHHHAHIAACMAENGRPLDAPPLLGIVLDGSGFGDDGTVWGGEVLACDYRGFERLGCLKPVALPGGAAAIREPWRNAYAHLMAEMGWAELAMNFDALPVFARLEAAPRATLDAMIAKGLNAPLASSCGRLFDAAAALCGLAWEAQSYEGEAAMAFEAAIDPAALGESDELAYPFALPLLGGRGLPYIEPLAVWRALLGDLHLGTPVGTIAARFHRGLAKALVALALRCSGEERRYGEVALSGGCFQNATLFALVESGLQAAGFRVLSHRKVPANDGGLALGQAVVALALQQDRGRAPCA
ncbi:MAG: carbamoyltransferase HypF [Rhodospirillales bacterium]